MRCPSCQGPFESLGNDPDILKCALCGGTVAVKLKGKPFFSVFRFYRTEPVGQRPMDHDAIRKALEPYLSEVDIPRDDVAGVTVKPFRTFDDDKGFLRWYEINDAIKKLGGSWVKATKYTKAHWRIPK